MNNSVPVIAILMPNALMAAGLRSILERMIPFAAYKIYSDFAEIADSQPEELFHIFVAAQQVIDHEEFFAARGSKTIVLTTGSNLATILRHFTQIDISQPQEAIERSLGMLHHSAHGGTSHPAKSESKEVLSQREIEVLKLVVDGLINKEIAERLNIGLSTVITHRKNIVEKLGVRSVAGLTIYAVMKKYIEI